jgi:ribonuclease BN (tRNA processing enzyme)
MMQAKSCLRVLGCSGGIGGPSLRTTAFLLDHDVLIDAGTGVQDLPLDGLARIDHIFVSHAHLDHVCSIPFIADAIGGRRSRPIVVHALAETIHDLKAHIFNWRIWPDFAALPSAEAPVIRFSPLKVGEPVVLGYRAITALPANHVVPAVGYRIDGAGGQTVVFTGDTGPNPALWREVNKASRLQALIIETAFGNDEADLAAKSRHLCPDSLAAQLAQLQHKAEVLITHFKPGEEDQVMREIELAAMPWKPRALRAGDVITF